MEYRHSSLESWQSSAPGWAHWSGRLSDAARETTEWLLARLGPRHGDTILELAAGAGDLGFEAARRADIRLITTDFSEPMLTEARRRAEALGVARAEFRVMDAERMDLSDRSVDGVLCRYGYMLMADPGAALQETRRVLRPDRRLALATWGPPAANDWTLFGRVLVERGLLPRSEPGQPGIFGLPDAETLEPLLSAAGFQDVEIDRIDFVLDYPDFDGYWDFVTRGAGAVTPVLARLSPDELAEYRREVEERATPFARPDGVLAFPASTLVAAATA